MAPALPKAKFLLVDDLAENLFALSTLLKRDDVELLQARSAPEALELLLVHDVALALLDVQMPEMDGFELAEVMRGTERTRRIPIIFITAGSRDQHRVFKGYGTGAVDFLYKPIEPHILKSKAEIFLELYRQKQQLVQQLEERTETLRLNEMFTAVLGHDLRNPLSAVLTSAELIERRSTDEGLAHAAGRIKSSSKRMSRMIEDLLDLARARLAGGIPLKSEPTELGKHVQAVVQEYQTSVPGSQVAVQSIGDLSGDWDPERIFQVAANLIGNALRHGQEGGGVRVVMDGSQPRSVSLRIDNSGQIPPETLPHIFDPFRGQRSSGRKDGLGLGLYLVQQIVQAHGGTVTVESTATAGTTFLVVFPRASGRQAGLDDPDSPRIRFEQPPTEGVDRSVGR